MNLPNLPASLDAERAVLGAVLLDNRALSTAVEKLKPDDFYHDHNSRIFQTMIFLSEAQQAIDLVTLTEELHHRNQLEAAGGAAYIAELVDGVPRVSNVGFYARIVKEKAVRRLLAHAGYAIQQAALDEEESLAEVYGRIEILSAQRREEVWAERDLPFRTGAEVGRETPAQVDWISRPWVAAGSITEVSGKVKLSGKTTLVTHLVGAVLDGAPFMGEPTTKTPVVYLTEQPPASFGVAMERAGLLRGDFNLLYWQDIVGTPWPEVMRDAVAECKRRGARLLVVDTLPQFSGIAGDGENNAGDALAAMQPLQQAAAEGIGVIVVRHDRKSGGEVGDSGRGSSAYGGAVDTVLSIRRPEGNQRRTVRLIRGVSRFDQTPDQLFVELTAHGYVALGKAGDVAAREARDIILAAAPHLEEKAAPLDVLLDGKKVKRSTAQRAAEELMADGRLIRIGKGKKRNPYRFWAPANVTAQSSAPIGQE